jgi:DNA-binding transcriptional ArsR family regulator
VLPWRLYSTLWLKIYEETWGRRSAPESDTVPPLDLVFAAVADPTRRAILASLRRGPATITELARPFPMSFAAVSKHVIVLERAGLIRREVVGREHHCHLAPQPLREATGWLERYRSSWEARLDAVERHVPAAARIEAAFEIVMKGPTMDYERFRSRPSSRATV